ncbi:Serine/threonine-protein kinase, partial [Quaeritorhiza haematococci]
ETAMRFLELSELLKNEMPSEVESETELYQMTYDSSLRDLQEMIQDEVVMLLIDPDSQVKRALLAEMPRLCIFFGRQRANDVLLSHMITYLNDPDWQLRSAFFESIVGVATFVGGRSLEEYILPLLAQALTDSEEFVVRKVLDALSSLAELRLLQKPKLKEFVSNILPLMCHPNIWIRYGAIAFVATAAKHLPLIDVRCIIYPMIRPFLKTDIAEVTELSLLENLKSPVSRLLYDQTLAFASRRPSMKSGMKPTNLSMQTSGADDFDGRDAADTTSSVNASRVPLSGQGRESNELLQRLRELGMTDEDKEKLFAMKSYIFKSTQSRIRKAADVGNQWTTTDDLEGKSGFVALKNFGITPHTVFLSPPPHYQRIISDHQSRRTSQIDEVRHKASTLSLSANPGTLAVYNRLSRVASESNIRHSDIVRKDSQANAVGQVPMPGNPGTTGTLLKTFVSHHHGHFEKRGSSFDASSMIEIPDIKAPSPSSSATAEKVGRPSSPASSSTHTSLGRLSEDSSAERKSSMDSSSTAMNLTVMRSPTTIPPQPPTIARTASGALISGKTKVAAATAMSSETATAMIDIHGAVPSSGSASGSVVGLAPSIGSPVSVAGSTTQQFSSGASASLSGFKRYSMHGRRGSDASIVTSGSLPESISSISSPANRFDNNAKAAKVAGDGRGRYIKRLLEKKTYELFPLPIPEMGPKVNPPAIPAQMPLKQRRSRTVVASSTSDLKKWRPEGTMVAHLPEHKGPINQLRLAPDHNFFVSCSNDGTVKVWDTQRLERNVTNRARLTYAQQGGHITSVAFCESSHSVASASDNGTIHVSRIEYISSGNAPKYNGYNVFRKISLENDDHVVALEHFDT